MSKRQLIEEIQKHNTTAQTRFLDQFDEAALTNYLERLEAAAHQQKRIVGWVRDARKIRKAG